MLRFLDLFESPDAIRVNGRYISYSHCDGGFTFGIIDADHVFVVEDTQAFYGHGTVIPKFDQIAKTQDVHLLDEYDIQISRPLKEFSGYSPVIKGRAWPKYKIVALWNLPTEAIISGTFEVLKLLNVDPTKMIYDVKSPAPSNGAMAVRENLTYAEFKKGKKISQEELDREEEDRLLYDKIMGRSREIPQQGHDDARFAQRQKGKPRQFIPPPLPKEPVLPKEPEEVEPHTRSQGLLFPHWKH